MTEPRNLRASRVPEALEALLGAPFYQGNAIRLLNNGDQIFPAMLEAIGDARRSVDLLTFVYWRGDIAHRFARKLAEKARQGVRVRVLLDALGAMAMPKALLRLMEAGGVQIGWFRPPLRWRLWEIDNRTHRKVLICDGRIGFTGGVGIAEEWEGDARNPHEWRDQHFRIEGPAVSGLQAAFVENWLETGRPVTEDVADVRPLDAAGDVPIQVIRTKASLQWSDIATLMHTLICVAEERLRITSAYFVPDPHAVRLLCEAAERGVRVELMIPGRYTDHRVVDLATHDDLRALTEAGVVIWRYQRTMLHTKAITVDRAAAVIGSANFNHRSMSKDDELALVVADEAFTGVLDRTFEADREHCEQLQRDDLDGRPAWRQAADGAMRRLRGQM